MGMMADLLFKLSRQRVLARRTGDAGENAATFDQASYQAWRTAQLRDQFHDHFDARVPQGLDLLDFGCGEGDLSFVVAELGPRSITAIDVDPERVASARARAAAMSLPVRPDFRVASNTTAIDLPDDSIDLILCFDVLEHVMDYEQILPEWRRVLRPGGRVFIWWVPWFHPYGHHVESLVPLPWVHALASDRAIIEACARVYDMPEFRPRVWDLDEEGNKKANKWRAMQRLPGVNKLTMARFEDILGQIGLRVDRRQPYGFRSSRFKAITGTLARLPVAREFCCSYVIYELSRV
ncbi:MAG: class I SAM-dependent methyltransferase [Planctomycetes bacterium]|nr:class I SAM-dependent methyltransferase [Planctomycetota bacterium]